MNCLFLNQSQKGKTFTKLTADIFTYVHVPIDVHSRDSTASEGEIDSQGKTDR